MRGANAPAQRSMTSKEVWVEPRVVAAARAYARVVVPNRDTLGEVARRAETHLQYQADEVRQFIATADRTDDKLVTLSGQVYEGAPYYAEVPVAAEWSERTSRVAHTVATMRGLLPRAPADVRATTGASLLLAPAAFRVQRWYGGAWVRREHDAAERTWRRVVDVLLDPRGYGMAEFSAARAVEKSALLPTDYDSMSHEAREEAMVTLEMMLEPKGSLLELVTDAVETLLKTDLSTWAGRNVLVDHWWALVADPTVSRSDHLRVNAAYDRFLQTVEEYCAAAAQWCLEASGGHSNPWVSLANVVGDWEEGHLFELVHRAFMPLSVSARGVGQEAWDAWNYRVRFEPLVRMMDKYAGAHTTSATASAPARASAPAPRDTSAHMIASMLGMDPVDDSA